MKRWLLLLALLLPAATYGQYLSRLHDVDSTEDAGISIRMKTDGTLLVAGAAGNAATLWQQLAVLRLNATGSQLTGKKVYSYPDHGLYQNNSGRMAALGDDYFALTPTIIFRTAGGNPRAAAALVKIDGSGDTVFLRSYTDTAAEREYTSDLSSGSNGDFTIGGTHNLLPATAIYSGLLLRTDSLGNLKWKHTYQKSSGSYCEIRSVAELPDGRILVGASSLTHRQIGQFEYYNAAPWIFLTDTSGNIVKQATLNAKYGAGNAPAVYADRNGGYYLYGNMDSLIRPADPEDFRNFPAYLAHLDSDLNITWARPFADTNARISIRSVRQLANGQYILAGAQSRLGYRYTEGWLAKIAATGQSIWERRYHADTVNDQQLADAVVRPDGSMVLCGSAKDHNSIPERRYDVWILGVDAQGCDRPGCGNVTTGVDDIGESSFRIYPLPAGQQLFIAGSAATGAALLTITDPAGRVMYREQTKSLRKPHPVDVSSMAPGIYLLRITTEEGRDLIRRVVIGR